MGVSTDENPGIHGVEYVMRNLLHMDQSSGNIELWLNNGGGELFEMWGVIDIIATAANPVDTVVYGNVSSAACLLLASGTGTRYAMPRASFMWHAGTTDITDDMHWPDAKDRMAWEERENDRWLDEMARVTKPRNDGGKLIRTLAGKLEFWSRHTRGGGELWLDAKDMVYHGIVDKIWAKK
jgi:ATP-dependent protease ClpP protease subunit